MAKYVLDTNIYIRALRDRASRDELARWQRLMAPRLYQHSVVAAEILVGARDQRTFERWHAAWVAPAERVRRVITPSRSGWIEAARILTRLVEARQLPPAPVKPGFFNDCLIATSAIEHGFTVITYNTDDFKRINAVAPGVQFRLPYP